MISQDRSVSASICYLANAQSIHTQRWARHFSGKGWKVTVLTFEEGRIDGVTVIPVGYQIKFHRWLKIISSLGEVKRLLREIKPDILHAHYATSYGLIGALADWHPYIVTAWGSDVLVTPESSWVYQAMVRFALGRADLVTTTAPNATEHVVLRRYTSREKIKTFPFGVSTNYFNLSARKGHAGEKPLIVSTRRMDYDSDTDVFIRAIPKILQYRPDAKFLMVGDGPLRPKLEQLANELEIKNQVDIIGEISYEEMPRILGGADIYVSTYPSDTNHISLNEAMACGTFPIVTDIVANRAWITHGENGLLFPCRDADRLADRIVDALGHPEWREAAAPRNWDIVRTKASWDQSMAVMEDLYFRLLRDNMQDRAGREKTST